MSNFIVPIVDEYPWYADIGLEIFELEELILYENLYWDLVYMYYE